MKSKNINRRKFIGAASAGSLGAMALSSIPFVGTGCNSTKKLAALGGSSVRSKPFIKWPYVDDNVVNSVVDTTKSGIWCRIQSKTGTVPSFEKKFAELMEAKYSVCVGYGTAAIHTSLEALGVGLGDEVITSPYTDPGTIAAILSCRALPVCADLDRESYQIDPADVERRITSNTKVLIPVHIMGTPSDLDRILAIAKKHNLLVVEDACQAHFAEHKGKKMGNFGSLGCFSFQTSKTVASGEGGAIIGNDEELMDKCYTVQNHGTSRRGRTERNGPKYRMNEFQGAVLMGQIEGARARYETRNENANYLKKKLKGFPGLVPQKLYDPSDTASFYLFAMSYHKEYFNNADRSQFFKAIRAEGIPLGGYIPNGLHKEPWVDYILNQKVYQKMYSAQRLRQFKEEMQCPVCDKVCDEMAMLWSSGPLTGSKEDMDDIINAIMKVYENKDQLSKL